MEKFIIFSFSDEYELWLIFSVQTSQISQSLD